MQDYDVILVEIWNGVKTYIPSKDRIDAAYRLVSVFDENGMSDGLEEGEGYDKYLKTAITSLFDIEEEEDDDEYGNDND